MLKATPGRDPEFGHQPVDLACTDLIP